MESPLSSRLRDVIRIVTLRRVPLERVSASWGHVAAALLLCCLPPTVSYYIYEAGAGRWTIANLPGVVFPGMLALVGAILAATSIRRGEAMAGVMFALLLAFFVIDVAGVAAWWASAEWLPDQENLGYMLYFATLGWISLSAARFVMGLHEGWSIRAIATPALVGAVFAAPFVYVQPNRLLYDHDYSRDARAEGRPAWMAAATEKAFYAQPGLLQAELDSIQPGTPGQVDVFFVGVAGYGAQDVFRREIEAVTTLMQDRFDAVGRTARLINNPKTVNYAPVASVTSLRAMLKRVGEQMDPEEDVLVLYMSSHGSEDQRFSLSLSPFQFDDLRPMTLKQALDDAGIHKRVVIVSSCYAGSFTKVLADPMTLVIAAAAPDRNSFGCGNEEEWTYFGRAYFDEALRKTYSLREAFRRAAPVIEARELEKKFKPSMPMMAGGEALDADLGRLERRLASLDGTTVHAAAPPEREVR